jgi:N6-adenosine-specific RNA methylase IME4
VKYRTIVADPPWPMPETGATSRGETDSKGRYTAKSGRVVDGTWWGRHRGGTVTLGYPVMTLDGIRSLPVAEMVEAEAHLYLWTTNRFVENAYAIARAWGFRPSQLLTWCKPPMGIGFGGAFVTTTEFVLFARRGTLPHKARVDSTWWQWSRVYEGGHIKHSAKPEAFLDLVEAVSPGPYLELFARRNRLGWDTWGNEALEHVELA